MKKFILILLLLFGLKSQAQVDWCDSLYYYTLPSPVFSVVGMYTDGVNDIADTVTWAWTVCNTSLCFSESGTYASFPLIQPTDTIKVYYNAYIASIPLVSCTNVCDSLVYNGSEWVYFPITNTVGVEELQIPDKNKYIVYDMQGRIVTDIKKNTIYILDKKKFIIFQRNK